MRIPTRLAAAAIVMTLALTGCGGSEESPGDDATSSASPADGMTIEGTDYSYAVPEGWEVPSGDIPGTEQTDTFAADTEDDDGFTDNVNVIRLDPAPIEDLDDLEQGLVDELENSGATNVSTRERLDIDGEEAVHIASRQSLEGNEYDTEQYNAIRDGVSYVVTFSFSPDLSEAERDAVSESILATWSWAA